MKEMTYTLYDLSNCETPLSCVNLIIEISRLKKLLNKTRYEEAERLFNFLEGREPDGSLLVKLPSGQPSLTFSSKKRAREVRKLLYEERFNEIGIMDDSTKDFLE